MYRDANFQDAEIVRSKKRGGHGPRAGPGGVQEQRHLGGPGEICHCDCISDVRIPLLSIPISDWFRAAHMTYHNFTVRP